eukprot:g1452.t1
MNRRLAILKSHLVSSSAPPDAAKLHHEALKQGATLVETDCPLLLARIESGVCIIVMNAPSRRNALGDDLTPFLRSLVKRIATDNRIRAVLLTGAGRSFCAGGNVKAMAGSNEDTPAAAVQVPVASRTDWTGLTAGASDQQGFNGQIVRQATLTGALHALPQPTLAVLPGAAAGAGLSIALACDLRIAATSAFVTTAFRRVALPGDYGASWLLPQLVGPAKAKQLFFTCERVPAPEALRLGIVQEVTADDVIHTRALELAKDIASGPAHAMRAYKRNINDAMDGISFREGLTNEAMRMTEISSNAEAMEQFHEATRAFVEKRKPNFH